jgi:hypothetical protein
LQVQVCEKAWYPHTLGSGMIFLPLIHMATCQLWIWGIWMLL